ncbi:hypothetical protein ACJX0J_021902, partial [Zea mays]
GIWGALMKEGLLAAAFRVMQIALNSIPNDVDLLRDRLEMLDDILYLGPFQHEMFNAVIVV